jgi:uncharacterized protein
MGHEEPSSVVALPQLHRRFSQPTAYSFGDYQLLPFSFTRLPDDDTTGDARAVAVNQAGAHVVLKLGDLQNLITRSAALEPALLDKLHAMQFVAQPGRPVAIDLLAQSVRSKLSTLTAGTALHIFVATLRCDHSCPYCQVSRVSDDRLAFDMSEDDARAGIDLMFESPSDVLKLEIQGGEPLLNFPIVQLLVEEASSRAEKERRELQCVVTTNLANVTPEMCVFFRDYQVQISTSIDGPEDLHNANRPRPGNDAYQRAVAGIQLVRNICGADRVSALPTTTKRSLGRAKEIVDTYLALGLPGIFLRPLSPFGFALKTQRAIGYDTQQFIDHYIEGVEYCIDLARRGYEFREFYASLLLKRMLTPFDTGYVDLMSPAGIGGVVLVFNYDGDVYASDEARMLSESGDATFKLGRIQGQTRQSLLGQPLLAKWLVQSMNDAIPGCDHCAYRPWCGTDPVYHYSTQGELTGIRALSAFCKRNMAVFNWLVTKLENGGTEAAILRHWGNTA